MSLCVLATGATVTAAVALWEENGISQHSHRIVVPAAKNNNRTCFRISTKTRNQTLRCDCQAKWIRRTTAGHAQIPRTQHLFYWSRLTVHGTVFHAIDINYKIVDFLYSSAINAAASTLNWLSIKWYGLVEKEREPIIIIIITNNAQ